MSRPVVALVGRTNVGKSTLLNRIVGQRHAVVDDQPNVTRDRLFVPVTWDDRDMIVVDTGGWGADAETAMDVKVKHQAELAVAQADVILLVVSATDGTIPSDEEAASLVRTAGKKAILVVNKVDTSRHETLLGDFHRLGIETVLPVSAIHNLGVSDLMDHVVELLPPPPAEKEQDPDSVHIAIVGRPNAGKSTLLNALLGDERAIVDSVPGTTRDSLDASLMWQDKHVVLVDTAGIRKRTRVSFGIDYFSVLRSMQAIDRCDVALLVLDAEEPATGQDVTIARYVLDSGKGLVLVVNKWDLIPKEYKDTHKNWLARRLEFFSYVPVIHVSALEGRNVKLALQRAIEVWKMRGKHLSRSAVDAAIQDAVARHAPPKVANRRLNVIWAHQDEDAPWKFVLHVNEPKLVPTTYQRYLEHQLRNVFGFRGVPLHFVFVKAGKPRKKREGAEWRE